ncbi:MAG: glycoside hydrolase family 3 N-terminal domain-containing protein [Bacteroidota bacterium]
MTFTPSIKGLFSACLGLLLASSVVAQKPAVKSLKGNASGKPVSSASNTKSAGDPRVEALLKQMTLEEKVGQMTQMDLSVYAIPGRKEVDFDTVKLAEGIDKWHIGSILNNGQDHAQDVATWHKIINTIQSKAGKSRLKIPVLYGVDAIHGATYLSGGTLFPQNIGIGCSRNEELARKAGVVTAFQTRKSGIPWNFAPVLDVGRQPIWPRFCETFGEDPYICGKLGSALINGMQGSDLKSETAVAACMKHFLGYSFPFSGKDRTPAYIPDWMLREIFLPPFTEAVKNNCKTVMVNSGEINGVPVHASKYILTDILRRELGFKGVVVTDWADVRYLHSSHKIASSMKEAVRLAVDAGIDMSMTPDSYDFAKFLAELVKEGSISEARVNESVRSILTLKYELGLFEKPMAPVAMESDVIKPEHVQLSLEAARESVVLLKNEKNALPLTKGKKYLVTGPAADWLPSLSGSWSFSWQGNKPELYAKTDKSFLTAFKEKAGEANVTYSKGSDFWYAPDGMINDAVSAAATADAIIVVLGEAAYAEGEGNIDDLDLPQGQMDLAKALAASGKPVTLVLLEGRPRVIRDLEPVFPGILLGITPGPQGSVAMSEILFGETNPSGKLCFTYPRFSNSFLLYDYKHTEINGDAAVWPPPPKRAHISPQFPFGYGLSYTTFEYSALSTSAASLRGDESLTVSLKVKNTGAREGKEAIDLFISDLYASLTPRIRRLRDFTKISLRAGEEKTVTFTIDKDDLNMVNADSKTVTEPGDFEIQAGGLKTKISYIAAAKKVALK